MSGAGFPLLTSSPLTFAAKNLSSLNPSKTKPIFLIEEDDARASFILFLDKSLINSTTPGIGFISFCNN